LSQAAAKWLGGFDARQYWESRHRATAGQLRATGHIHLSEEENEADYRAKRSEIEGVLRRHCSDPMNQTLLDAGCGTGIFTEAFVDMGFTVTGVDFSSNALESARRRTMASFLVADLASMRMDDQFDVIASVDVLFHVVEDRAWRRTLGTLGSHLKRGGTMLIQEHLVAELPGGASAQQGHVHFRTMEQYRRTLGGLKLRVVSQYQYELPSERSWKNILVVEHSPGV
jgi:ubiquinone/menaquinone biosynthesis C-methylase UbiE